MKEYIIFVWQSLSNPHSIMDILPAAQLLLFIIFIILIIKAIISKK
jgi:hypothetical protein